VLNYTDEEAVTEMKFSVRVSQAEHSSGVYPGEGFSSNATDISQSKGYDPSFDMYMC